MTDDEKKAFVIARLRALADGSYTPEDRANDGVCYVYTHIWQEVYGGKRAPSLARYFHELGFTDCINPLGTYFYKDLYDETVGPARRELAGKVADWLEKIL